MGKTSDTRRMVGLLRPHADELEAFRDRLQATFGRKVTLSEAAVIAVRKCMADAEHMADEITSREMAKV